MSLWDKGITGTFNLSPKMQVITFFIMVSIMILIVFIISQILGRKK